MKLNPKKCTFGVEEGMLLGYKVKSKGLKVCPDKVDAVLNLPSPKCLKDVQKLNGKLASLNRFLAKSVEKSLPFFKTLRKCTKKSDFHWTTEEEKAFKQMKKLIAELPMLTAPREKEELIVYLAPAKETVSAVLMTEKEAKQMPIYFVSRALRGPELNYTSMEKLVLALVHASKRLKRIAKQIGVKNLQANVDSRLVANQVNGTYVAKEADMISYMEKVKALTGSFKAFTIKQIPRSENKKADALSKIASTSFAHLSKQVLVKELKENSISEVEVLAVVEEEGDTWMTPIFKYLAEDTLPTYVKKARAIRRKSWRFTVTNGLVERANRSLGEGIKARLEARSKNWMEELPHVLWAYRTMIKSSNGDTQFSLTYGTEAIIPAEIGMPTLRTTEVDLVQNNEALEINLDLLEEGGKEAVIREAKRDLVYRNNNASRVEDTGKLGPKWEGPYEVTESLGKGAYKLKD
ncbi:reverse transcriptase domain-containing protein, partial [Tanacetum coccineum]